MTHITDAKRDFYGLSFQHALGRGRAFAIDLFTNIPASATNILTFTTNGSPVQLLTFSVNTLSDHTELSLWGGGSYSGGNDLFPVNLNLVINSPSNLFSDSREGVTEDTAGVRARTRNVLGSGSGQNRDVASGGVSGGIILNANSTYAVKILNLDNAAQDYDIEIILADLDGTP